MGVSVQAILEHPVLAGASVVAGREGLEAEVCRVAPITCRALWDASGDRVAALFEPHLGGLLDEDESALPFADGRVSAVLCRSEESDSLPANLVRSCSRYRIPLIQLAPNKHWDEVYPALLALLSGTDVGDPVREAFVRASLAGGGIHGILELLRFLASNPVILVSPTLQMIDHSGRNRYPFDLERGLSAIARAVSAQPVPASAPDLPVVHVAQIQVGAQDHTYLAIVEARRPLGAIGKTALARAAEMAEWQHIHDSRRRLDWNARTHFLTELLLGRFSTTNSARTWATSLGIKLAPKYQVIVVTIDDFEPSKTQRSGHVAGIEWIKERIADLVDDAVTATGTSSLAVGFSDSVAAAIGLPAGTTPREAAQSGHKLAQRIRAALHHAFRDVTVTIGLGMLVSSVSELPKGYSQARHVAALGRLIHGKGGIHTVADLGIFRLLSRLDDLNCMREFADDVLGTLEAHDASGQAPILPTLEAFLAADGNRLKCANELYLHPNTVSYRLSLVEKLTGLSPFRTEDRFLIQTALKVRQYLLVQSDDGLPAPIHITGESGAVRGRAPQSRRNNSTTG